MAMLGCSIAVALPIDWAVGRPLVCQQCVKYALSTACKLLSNVHGISVVENRFLAYKKTLSRVFGRTGDNLARKLPSAIEICISQSLSKFKLKRRAVSTWRISSSLIAPRRRSRRDFSMVRSCSHLTSVSLVRPFSGEGKICTCRGNSRSVRLIEATIVRGYDEEAFPRSF